MKLSKGFLLLLLAGAVGLAPQIPAQPPTGYSEHGAQEPLVPSAVPDSGKPAGKPSAAKAVVPSSDASRFVVLGYVQSDTTRWAYHWHALTHIAISFTDFNATGNLTNVSNSITTRTLLFKPGGIADRHGVKVLMTLRNTGFDGNVLNAVMPNPALRATLVAEVAAVVNNASDNIAGVNLDFEPHPYGPGVGQGIVDFLGELRAALNPGKEISIYIGPTYSAANYPNLATAAASVDFFNISCYPYAGSFSTLARSITSRSGYVGNTDSFFDNGVPPEKMVLTLGSYGYRWETTVPSQLEADAYSTSILSNIGSWGFADAKFETTLSATPKTRRYQTAVESPFYASQIAGSTFRTVVYEDEESLAIKMRDALSWPGDTAPGRQLGGVGFWSLAWLSKDFLDGYHSYDLEASENTTKFRTYPHIFQVMQETFAPPGTNEYLIEKWEYYDAIINPTLQNQWDRWRNPDEGPDDTGLSSATRSIVATPAGVGIPSNSDYCAQISYTFSATAGNKFFYRWEILGDDTENSVRDFNATRALFPIASRVSVDVHTTSALPGATIRFVLLDGNGQLERGPATSLNAAGWRTVAWDLTTGGATGYNTAFNQYLDGNGTIDTVPGKRDLAVIGFLVEGGGAASSGVLRLDELRWSPVSPAGTGYVINEFAYRINDGEFIEIHGPAGAIPSGIELRVYSGVDGSVAKTIPLSGAVVPAGGRIAWGDPATGAAITTGFSDAVDDLSNTGPIGLQIVNTATQSVSDSVVYEAHGGLGDLVRPATKNVTGNGWPWIGEVATGSYSIGRYPDGANTGVNGADFGVMPRSVGAANGGAVSLPAAYNFASAPTGSYFTYTSMGVGAVASGVAASPSGGQVFRVADVTGGGNIAFIGDAALGSDGNGLVVTGEIYIPGGAEPNQAIGVGFCGSQGSTFFTGTPAASGYENGYWLFYQNNASAEINNGLGAHAGEFRFALAQNDNMSPQPTIQLGAATLVATGATAGAWTTFRLEVNPVSNLLEARVNGAIVYTGTIPTTGRTTGAVQIGFRENHSGNPAASEGTWIDNLTIQRAVTPGGVKDFISLN